VTCGLVAATFVTQHVARDMSIRLLLLLALTLPLSILAATTLMYAMCDQTCLGLETLNPLY
jgi:hypothetical protein